MFHTLVNYKIIARDNLVVVGYWTSLEYKSDTEVSCFCHTFEEDSFTCFGNVPTQKVWSVFTVSKIFSLDCLSTQKRIETLICVFC